MIAIACIDAKNGIGKDGKLLISIPDDMNFFRATTKDNIVVMGRKTLFSFKDKMPLKNRVNVVFTSNKKLQDEYKNVNDIYFVNNMEELNTLLDKFKSELPDKKVFVIGGASIYDKLIDVCDTCLITRLDKAFDADTYFPNLESHGFHITNESDIHTHGDIKFKFLTYEK